MKLARLGEGPEIFHTLQGEGVSVGLPAVFIRASRCNLHCVWCDTDHTWNFTGTPWPHEKNAVPGYTAARGP
jgi:organic radical activating enzyme